MIELLVVMTIMSLLIVIVPHFAEAIPSLRFRREVNDLIYGLRYGHALAMSSGQPVVIEVDAKLLTWSDSRHHSHPLGPVVSRMSLSLGISQDVLDSLKVRFYADGSATPAEITLEGAGHTETLSIEWVTSNINVIH